MPENARYPGFDDASDVDLLQAPALLAALRRGDATAFDRVYGLAWPRLVAFLRRLGAEGPIAEELAQETLLRLAHHARSLRPDSSLRAWIFAVARNLLRDHQRRRLLEFGRLRDIDSAQVHGEAAVLPDALADSERSAARLEAALQALPPLLREAIVLVAIEGFDPSVAAKMVDVPAATLRQRLSRARSQLRDALDAEPATPARNGDAP